MSQAAAVELVDIWKRFPGVVANAGANLRVERGTVHAVLGENGAGKSTLMNVLSGVYRPDEGEVRLDGTPQRFHTPADALAAGIGMVHQEFRLVPSFTVAENVVLGSAERILRRQDVEARRAEIIAGTFHVFSGPINDQDGYEAVAAGETLDDGALLGMEFFVQGVIGTLG